MKKLALWALSLALLCIFVPSGYAQVKIDPLGVPVIEVTGKAEIAVEPDSATISVDFTKLDKNLEAARKANEDGVSKMLGIAKKFEIPTRDVRTNNISVSMKYTSVRDRQKPIYDDDDNEVGIREFQGYEVSRSVTIKLTKLEQFDAIFNEILATQPTEIDSVAFETSRLIELREKAREMAMKAAHEKAKAMTRAIGQTVGKALRINEGTSSDRYSRGSNSSANTFIVDGQDVRNVTTKTNLATFSAGSIQIEASVTVVFQLN
jgi:uncharacterized protein YggE